MLRLDDNHDALVTWPVPRVLILAQVLLRHPVDEGLVGVRFDSHDGAANLEVSVWILGIEDREGDPWLSLNVLQFLARGGLAKSDRRAIPVKPNRVVLRLAVRPDGPTWA